MNIDKAVLGLRRSGNGLLIGAVALLLLYFGRSVFIPLALAIMLSLLLAPAVRALQRLGIGRTPSVLIAVLAFAVSCVAATLVLGTQMIRFAERLPQYEANVERKLDVLDEVVFVRLRALAREAPHLVGENAGGWIRRPSLDAPIAASSPPSGPSLLTAGPTPARPLRLMGSVLRSVWPPIQACGIVLLVLTFVLFEHGSLRDRFIRIAGAADIRATTLALNDASERLSRFFVAQFAVNLGFGIAICVILSLLHVPGAALCASLAALMRFVPYVGIAISALFATALAFAADPGWLMPVSTFGAFIVLDSILGQLIEPRLYGHATGLSSLSVVVAAIFWSSLWGPVGLVLSTPLTLCLLVAGRHVKALGFLEVLLGDLPVLTLAQNFYQRALSADPHEIMGNAGAFLRTASLAAYCDRVLLPALHLARLDAESGATTEEQQGRIRRVVIDVVSALTREPLKLPRAHRRGAVLNPTSPGTWLRQERERVSGRWQGPLGAPACSVVICMGIGSVEDGLAAELLVRLLRIQAVDARHFAPHDMEDGLPSGADPEGVALVYLVSAFPSAERERFESTAAQVNELFPHASLVKVWCAGLDTTSSCANGVGQLQTACSLDEAIQLCITSQRALRMRPASQPGASHIGPSIAV